jgi:hypothetical protein
LEDALDFGAEDFKAAFVPVRLMNKRHLSMASKAPNMTPEAVQSKMDEEDGLLLVKLSERFLRVLLAKGQYESSIKANKEFTSFASTEDVCFMVLLFENYWDIWVAVAEEGKKNPHHKLKKHSQVEARQCYGLLSQPRGQKRLSEIRSRVKTLLAEESEKRDSFNRMFAAHVRALQPPNSNIVSLEATESDLLELEHVDPVREEHFLEIVEPFAI